MKSKFLSSFSSSFRFPSYRLLWSNSFINALSQNAFNILMTWLILETTESVLFFSIAIGLGKVPSLFGLIAGLIADKFDRRKLLMIFNIGSIMTSLSMGIAVMNGLLPSWYVLVAILLKASFNSFSMPTRQVLTMDFVGKENLTNAFALNNLAMRIAGVIGSSLIGAFFYWLGMGPFFFLVGAMSTVGLFALTLIKQSKEKRVIAEKRAEKSKSVIKDLADGLRYVGSNSILLGLQLIALSHNLFTGPCLWTLMPLFVRNVLNIDASGLGWINTILGLGSLFCAISIASLHKSFKRKGWLLLFAFMEGSSWVLFSISNTYYLAGLLAACSSIGSLIYMTMIRTLLLVNSDPDMRGRVMGVRQLVIGPQSICGVIWGVTSQIIGVPTALAVAGSLHCLFVLTVLFLVPRLKRLE